jgi:hypothetical protein
MIVAPLRTAPEVATVRPVAVVVVIVWTSFDRMDGWSRPIQGRRSAAQGQIVWVISMTTGPFLPYGLRT